MAEPNRKKTVIIMGREYPIKSDADPAYLQKLAKYVEEKIQGVSLKNKLPSQFKNEVLAAIIIADEYFSEKDKNAQIEQKVEELTGLLEQNLSGEPVN